MKSIRLISIIFLAAVCMSAYAITPKTETSTWWMRITDVERTDSALRVGIRLQNYPHYWVMVEPSTHLVASEDTTLRYKMTAYEKIEPGKKIWMPDSGQFEGVLIFEKVPEYIKVVDMVENDGPADIETGIYGIHLDQPEDRVQPDLITMEDILNHGNKPAEPWAGPDPKRYADMKFHDRQGMAHIRGRITDYSPRYGVSTFSVRTKDDFTDNEKLNVGNINPDGTFELDFPLTYPQFDYFRLGNISKNIFLVPGDTLDIASCMATKVDAENGYVPEYFGFEGTPDDAVVINMLADSLYNRYHITQLFRQSRIEDTDSMAAETYRKNEQLAALLDSICEELPLILGDLPISVFAKDMISLATIEKVCEVMESIQMYLEDAKGPRYVKGEDDEVIFKDGETIDDVAILKPWLRHKDIIYDNPAIVCTGWVLPNRWRFNSQFRPTSMAARGMAKIPGTTAYMSADDPSELFADDMNRLDSIGAGNCFAAQLVRAASLIGELKTSENPSSESLEQNNRFVAKIIRHNDYELLNEILMSEYNSFVKDVMIAENQIGNYSDSSIIILDSPEGNVLARIIEPYKGNVLFLDFWGIGCGPCRSGMIYQKEILKKLADKPFRALYIANGSEAMDACKKWLRNEDIKGEHIFVSYDDWQRLGGLLNFSSIPFGVLIDKNGNIIKNDYRLLQENEPLLMKALQE